MRFCGHVRDGTSFGNAFTESLASRQKAKERGEDMSTVIRAALERYVKKK
jgi:hypothetical protein